MFEYENSIYTNFAYDVSLLVMIHLEIQHWLVTQVIHLFKTKAINK